MVDGPVKLSEEDWREMVANLEAAVIQWEDQARRWAETEARNQERGDAVGQRIAAESHALCLERRDLLLKRVEVLRLRFAGA